MDLSKKCSVDDIRQRFDKDVERFSNLDTAQSSTIDAPLVLELITQAAFHTTEKINNILDIGCGAGNNTLKLLELVPNANCDLLDLSQPMLERAKERVSKVTTGQITIFHDDFREAKLDNNKYDVILAAAVLHHLRDDNDWQSAFQKIYDLLAPNGTVWITDLVSHENKYVQEMMWKRYGEYLVELGGKEYKENVFDYIAFEDSPRPVTYQLDLLRKVGFKNVDILHKNSCFAAFGAKK